MKEKEMALVGQRGATLIETMVALIILAVGTLGVLAMQVNAFRLNQNAYLYSQASILANDIYDAMQTVSVVDRNALVGTNGDDSSCSGKSSTVPVEWYGCQWSLSVNTLLPGGGYSISKVADSDSAFTISITFDQSSSKETNEDGWTDRTDNKGEYLINVEF